MKASFSPLAVQLGTNHLVRDKASYFVLGMPFPQKDNPFIALAWRQVLKTTSKGVNNVNEHSTISGNKEKARKIEV